MSNIMDFSEAKLNKENEEQKNEAWEEEDLLLSDEPEDLFEKHLAEQEKNPSSPSIQKMIQKYREKTAEVDAAFNEYWDMKETGVITGDEYVEKIKELARNLKNDGDYPVVELARAFYEIYGE